MRDIFIPATGMARDDVIIESWLKEPGDSVAIGDVVAVVETSKAVIDVQTDAAGVLGPHLVPAREAVAPGTTIAHVLENGEAAASFPAATRAAPPDA